MKLPNQGTFTNDGERFLIIAVGMSNQGGLGMGKHVATSDFTRQIKSRERVRDLAEVFTSEREVSAMLDLLGAISANITARYLEPACGNGNFLVAILERKLNSILSLRLRQREFEFLSLQAVASIYGIDICPENVAQARERMRVQVIEAYSQNLNTLKMTEGFLSSLDFILETNIQVGDMLDGADKISVTEFTAPKPNHFMMTTFMMADLMRKDGGVTPAPRPFSQSKSIAYWRLA